MFKDAPGTLVLLVIICISLFGSFSTVMFALNPPLHQDSFRWRKQLVGSIFAAICLSGIVAVFYPRSCSDAFNLRKKETTLASKDRTRNPKASVAFMGHHPDCGRFSTHIIHAFGRVLCISCTGLCLGAVFALTGAILYFFAGWDDGLLGLLAVLVGQIGVLFGFIQFKFKGYVRVFVNAFFAFAAFLTLAGVDNLTGNMLIDLYVIALILFWLLTRIQISQWNHLRICKACNLCN